MSNTKADNPLAAVDHLDIWTGAWLKKAGTGRGKNGKLTPYGIQKLRELILELAVRGQLVPQDPSDEPASTILERIAKEKTQLVKEGKVRKQKKLPEITENEKPFDLPEGWIFVRLGEIAYSQAGFAFKSRFFNGNQEGLPLIRIRDVGQPFSGTYYSGNYRDEFIVNDGDYLISMDGEFRVAEWKNGTALLNQRVSRLIFFLRDIGRRFVVDSLQARLRELQGVKAYTTVDHLSGKQITESAIALPPLAEQHRIVAKVDELMALCDRLEQEQTDSLEAHQTLVETLLRTLTDAPNAEAAQQAWTRIAQHFDTLFTTEHSIDQLKQTILQLAVMGKLVPQDPNDEPAIVLLEKIAEEKARLVKEGKIKKQKKPPEITQEEMPFELPEGWEWARFSEYAVDIGTGPFGSMIHRSDYVENGVPLINPSHMIDDQIVPDAKVSVSKEMAKKLETYALAKGDIVMARRGEVGRIALVAQHEAGWLCGTGSFVLRFSEHVFRDYLKLVFRCDFVRRYLAGEAVGTTMVNLNHGILKKMPFGVPPLAEQHRIVAKVDKLMALCDALKARIQQAETVQRHLADAVVQQSVAV